LWTWMAAYIVVGAKWAARLDTSGMKIYACPQHQLDATKSCAIATMTS